MNTLIALALGLFLGTGFGFLVAGVLTVESRQEDIEEAKETIQRQAKTIADQSVIIAGLHRQLDEMEDDYK